MSEQAATKVGLYVDVANVTQNGGRGMRYDVLRDFAARGSSEPIRLNAYVTYDARRAKTDEAFKRGQLEFHSVLRDFGYKVVVKQVKWYSDGAGGEYGKANADLDMAVDALLQSENLDRVVLATGDGDFVQVVRALQNKGCRVEVVAFDNVSGDLKREADLFLSGSLIPGLLPTTTAPESKVPWGEDGSRVRGFCYTFLQDKLYGWMRYLKTIGPALWQTDSRRPDSPYGTAFVHVSQFQDFDVGPLPSRDYIFEFTLTRTEKGLQAHDVVQVSPPPRRAEAPTEPVRVDAEVRLSSESGHDSIAAA